MDAGQRFQAAAELFLALREIPTDQIASILDQQCGEDAALRADVQRLIDARDDPSVFHTLAGQLRSVNANLRRLSETSFPSSGAPFVTDDGSPEERANDVIGPFRLIEQVGEGGFGRVWIAEQNAPVKRRVALKLIKAGMDSREVLSRFEMERQALAVMEHPGVAKVFDAGMTERGRPYFVMEHVPGPAITSFCDSGRLRIRERLNLFTSVCDAVHHAHQKGIIHRDLKPSNILVTLIDGRPLPKVIDFGIAKATGSTLGEHDAYTEVGRLMGTPEYMSPEQAGGGRDVDTRSDVYSLGVILYQLLTGTLPFDGQMLREAGSAGIARIIRELEPPKPSTRFSTLIAEPVTCGRAASPTEIASQHGTDVRSLQRELRGDLDWIVMKCLEKDRCRRYESVKELAVDVERHQAGKPVVAAPPSFEYAFGKFVRRHRMALAATSAVLFTLILGFGVSTVFYFQERDARRRAVDAEATQKSLREQADDAREAEASQRAAAETQRDIARTEAAKAEKINAFLQNMLSAIEPDRAKGREITVRETLDEASARIDDDALHDEPDVQAALRSTIGRVYARLARYEDAERHLVAALNARRALFGEEHALVASSMLELGSLRYIQGNYAAAEVLFRQCVAMRVMLLGEKHPDVMTAQHALAANCSARGQLDEADALFAAAMDARRDARQDDDLATADSLNEWGQVRHTRGDFDGAERLWREALEIGQRAGGEDSQTIATTYNNLAALHYSRGDYPAAIDHFQRVLDIRRRVLGAEHPDTAACLRNLATALAATSRLAEAETHYRDALELQRRSLAPDHPHVATTAEGLAVVLLMLGDYDQAETLQREALDIRTRAFPPDHPLVAQSHYFMGRVLIDRERYGEAEAAIRTALELRRKSSEDLVVADILANLGRVRRLQGDLVDAERFVREAVALARRVGGEGHPRLAMALNELGLVLEPLGDVAAAEQTFRDALAIQRDRQMLTHRDAASVMHNLGELLHRCRKASEAEALLQEALRNRASSLPEGHRLIESTRAALSAVQGEVREP
ncbi:MAG: tetratricopeptide repeat protein [Phycisphaerae bacterium]